MKSKGFTLVELIVTIAILALLATIAVVAVTRVRNNTETDINKVQNKILEGAANQYYIKNFDENKDKEKIIVSIQDLIDTGFLKASEVDKAEIDRNKLIVIDGTGNSADINFDVLLSDKILYDNPVNSGKPDFSTVATTDEGVFKDVDADGDTYYFRGDVEDNYVKIGDLKWKNTKYLNKSNIEEANIGCSLSFSSYGFNSAEECKEEILIRGHALGDDMLWRIVRVNGDGTIRLITDGIVGNSTFNTTCGGEKYAGYTYDNSAPNVQDGTNSTIKTYLENWYTTNLSEYDSLIASTRYCNDTTVSEIINQNIYFGANIRMYRYNKPQFTCPNTEKTYGGEYKLKIGLLSADEAVFAGGNVDLKNFDYYLYKYTEYWLSSPSAVINTIPYIETIWYYGYIWGLEIKSNVAPVINLRADILYTSGEGTKSSPYVVNLNSI